MLFAPAYLVLLVSYFSPPLPLRAFVLSLPTAADDAFACLSGSSAPAAVTYCSESMPSLSCYYLFIIIAVDELNNLER